MKHLQRPNYLGSTDPYMPMPDPITGELLVDPEIFLKTHDIDLNIGFFYSSIADLMTEFGVGRSASSRASATVILDGISSAEFGSVINRPDLSQFAVNSGGGAGPNSRIDDISGIIGHDSHVVGLNELFEDGMRFCYTNINSSIGAVGGIPTPFPLETVLHPSGSKHVYSYSSNTVAIQGVEFPCVSTIQDNNGRLVTFTYGQSAAVTLASGAYAASLVTAITDWGGRVYSLIYDAAGYLTTLTSPLGCTTKFMYGLAGTASSTMLHTIEDPRGFITTYMYDSMRRVASMAAGQGIWTWTYAGDNSMNSMQTPTSSITTYIYNTGGNMTALEHPEGYTSTFTYASNATLTYSNRIRASELTPAGWAYSVTLDNPVAFPSKILQSRDPLGNCTSFSYNIVFPPQVATITDAAGGTTAYTYPAVSQIPLEVG